MRADRRRHRPRGSAAGGQRGLPGFRSTAATALPSDVGGAWDTTGAVRAGAVSYAEAVALGQDALTVIVEAVRACVDAGDSASTDPVGDAVSLWVALHGLAHQRAVIPNFPWPEGIADRLVQRLAQLQWHAAAHEPMMAPGQGDPPTP